ncbi:MAG TPA: cysteine desulfurase family protein [Candidatus Binataceae bacterium]|nr:cysteine desulfurase family protein [Candidatus Binataceae bacterium]
MRIYLDHNASAPIRRSAIAAMARVAQECHGNPASIHHSGQRARKILEEARQRVATLIGASARTIVFTSGGTEANNLAVCGAARASGERRIITSAIEHSSVLAPVAELERSGFAVQRLIPDRDGRIAPEQISEALDDNVGLVTLGLANAEVGTIQQLAGIGEAIARRGALFHLDAAQAVGRIPLDVAELGCDLMTLSAHKIGGPAGCGALYVRPGTHLEPAMLGGPQEAGLRAGTPNLLGAVGFGAAAEEVLTVLDDERMRVAELASFLFARLAVTIRGLSLNGPIAQRLPNTLNLTFPGVLGESLLIALDLEGIEVSMGSACAAGAVEPSHVLLAMGRTPAEARSSLRISLGWNTQANDIARAASLIPRVYQRVAAAAVDGETAVP